MTPVINGIASITFLAAFVCLIVLFWASLAVAVYEVVKFFV